MSERKRILFIINNEIVVEETKDMTVEAVERMKRIVAKECECRIDEVEVHYEDLNVEKKELSSIDVTNTGLMDWKDPDFKELTKGIQNKLVEGSDEHLDAILNGTELEFLIFV